MKTILFSVTAVLCAFYINAPHASAADVAESDAIVISASRYETSIAREGKDITVITAEEIKESGKKDLSQVLESVPGITVSKGSGIDSIFIRGSKRGNVLILIDGVKVSDPFGIDKVVDLSLIKTDNIERIEVVEGAMSSMYGSEASSGVINIITKRGTGNFFTASVEGGAYNTLMESVSVSERNGKNSFYFSGSHYTSGGISQAKDMTGTGHFDRDKTETINASCKMEGSIWDRTTMIFSMNFADKKSDIDAGAGSDDPNNKISNRLFTSGGEFRHNPFDFWDYRVGLSYSSFSRINTDPADSVNTGNGIYTYDSSSYHLHYINNIRLFGCSTLSLGAEVLNESGSDSSTYYDPANPSYTSVSIIQDKSVMTRSLFVHDATSFADMLYINFGGRVDRHDMFGNHYSWDTSAAFVVPVIKTRLRTSAGSGFKAPSLYELYDGYSGNKDLKPEKNFVYDAGVSQDLFKGILNLNFTFFYQKYKDMIGTDAAYKYINLSGEIEDRGYEASAVVKFDDLLTLRYGYTYTSFIRYNSEMDILRKPKNKHTASVTVKPVTDLTVTASYLYVDSRLDYKTSTQYVKLSSYQKIDMNIRYRLTDVLTLSVRGENLTNAHYMEAYGYNTKGRSFYGGAEMVL